VRLKAVPLRAESVHQAESDRTWNLSLCLVKARSLLEIQPTSTLPLAIAIAVFCALMLALAFWSRSQVSTEEDFIVAGRRMPMPLATATILATWFGAGTLLVAADAVRDQGLRVSILEPFGAGVCLFLAAIFFARRLWEARLLTIIDLFRRRWGRTVEVVASIYTTGYFAWVATQFVSLGGIIHLFFGINLTLAILLVAGFLLFYTLLGGMWSVAITDFAQVVLLAIGLCILTGSVLSQIGHGSIFAGSEYLVRSADHRHMVFLPLDRLEEFVSWVNLFVVGSLGNLYSQDLAQRIFASRSAKVAVTSCVTAGVLYILLGAMPVVLGLAGSVVLGDDVVSAVIPALAARFLSPAMSIVFVLTLMSAVMSSVDSGLLAPASVIAQNLLKPMLGSRAETLSLVRWCVALVAVCSVGFAVSGQGTFELLQRSYSVGIPPLVVMFFAVYSEDDHPLPPLLTLLLGLVLWFGEIGLAVVNGEAAGWLNELPVPMPLVLLAASLTVYVGTLIVVRRERMYARLREEAIGSTG
jgi:solute:Na+ symporter, SSS family